jgi:hypothetical protein
VIRQNFPSGTFPIGTLTRKEWVKILDKVDFDKNEKPGTEAIYSVKYWILWWLTASSALLKSSVDMKAT